MLGLKKNKKDKDGKKKSEKKDKKGKDKKSVGSSEDVVEPVYSTKAQRTLLVIDSESRDWAPLFSPVQGSILFINLFNFHLIPFQLLFIFTTIKNIKIFFL
jgi:hypothetical protein